MGLVKPLDGLIVQCATRQAITLTAGGQWTLTHVSYRKVYVRSIYNILCWWDGHPSRLRQDPVSSLPPPECLGQCAGSGQGYILSPSSRYHSTWHPSIRPLPPGILHPTLPHPFFSRLTHKGFHMLILFRCVNTNNWANVRSTVRAKFLSSTVPKLTLGFLLPHYTLHTTPRFIQTCCANTYLRLFLLCLLCVSECMFVCTRISQRFVFPDWQHDDSTSVLLINVGIYLLHSCISLLCSSQ